MSEHHLVVMTGPGLSVPGRIATLLLPLDIEIIEMSMTASPDATGWSVQLRVRTGTADRVELLIKRLNRLVEVHRVVALEGDSHRRQSIYVRLRPKAVELPSVREVLQWFDAETLEVDASGMMLHLNATPQQCEAFVTMLRPHHIIEVITGAVTAVRAGTRSTFGHPSRQRCASVTPLTHFTQEKAQ